MQENAELVGHITRSSKKDELQFESQICIKFAQVVEQHTGRNAVTDAAV